VHKMADEFRLAHTSVGKGRARHVLVTKWTPKEFAGNFVVVHCASDKKNNLPSI
jgi:hypothetical protein